MTALAVVALVAIASFGFLYTTHEFGIFPAPSSTSTSTACTRATSTTSSAGANGTYALICTNLGLIEVQLFPAAAPKTVANFVQLANSGFYNGLVWHRIVPGFVIQTGDPNTRNGSGNRATWGQGTSGTNIPFEYNATLHNYVGYVAMASTGAQVGGSSQFYINLADNSATLDGKYAVFGQVINGMSVVQALAKVPINTDNQPVTSSDAVVISVTIQSTP